MMLNPRIAQRVQVWYKDGQARERLLRRVLDLEEEKAAKERD